MDINLQTISNFPIKNLPPIDPRASFSRPFCIDADYTEDYISNQFFNTQGEGWAFHFCSKGVKGKLHLIAVSYAHHGNIITRFCLSNFPFATRASRRVAIRSCIVWSTHNILNLTFPEDSVFDIKHTVDKVITTKSPPKLFKMCITGPIGTLP